MTDMKISAGETPEFASPGGSASAVADAAAIARRGVGTLVRRVAAPVRTYWLTAALLTVITFVGLALRLENVNWDRGQHLHPDERFLAMVTSDIRSPDSVGQYFDSAESPLNPYNHTGSFVYGTLPLFLNKAVAEWLDQDVDGSTHASADVFRGFLGLLGFDLERDDGKLVFDGEYNSNLVGRVLSAIADMATVLLVFELGRVLWGRRVGLLAAALLSLTVLHIQYSHFFGSETFLAFFVTATIYGSVRIWKYGTAWNYAWTGVALGCALATKLSAIPVLLVPGLAVLAAMSPELSAARKRIVHRWRTKRPLSLGTVAEWSSLLTPAILGIASLIVAGLVFRVAQPYAFEGPGFFDVFRLDLSLRDDVLNVRSLVRLEFLRPTHYIAFSEEFRKDISGLLNQQSGADFPPNIQWIGRTPYLFPLSNLVLWGLGPPLALAALGGLAYSLWRMFRHRDFTGFLLLSWVVFFFWFIARGFNPTMRYFLPIYPSLAVIAAFGLWSLWHAASRGLTLPGPLRNLLPSSVTRAVPRTLVVAAFAGTLLWALAFTGIYRQDMSRVQASRWIGQHVPPGSVLTSNEWDDGLPLNLPGISPAQYNYVQLKPYAEETPEKIRELVDGLARADYIVESSNRIYGSIPRAPARYPVTTLYYRRLFDGSLGFEKVAEFTNYPRLFGIEIPDQGAEEAFTVYDHPKVTIWKKTPAYSRERALALLQPEKAETAVQMTPKEAGKNALQLRPDVLEKQQRGGTWTDIFDAKSFANQHPLIVWFAVVELLGFAMLPLGTVLFRWLPDRGYLLTKPLGFVVFAYLVWGPVSFGLADFTRPVVFSVFLAILLFGVVTRSLWGPQLRELLRERWRSLLLAEALFIAAFLAAFGVRLANPDLWHPYRGGEKPMELAYLNAVTRSTTMPPYDPWYAGGYINYYYYGQFMTANLIKLTGILPEIAFNLALPTYFAFTAGLVASIAYNLVELARRALKRAPGFRRIPAWSSLWAAGLAVFLVLLAGNFRGMAQGLDRLTEASPWQSSVPVAGPVIELAGGAWKLLTAGGVPYDYWDPSRAIHLTPDQQNQTAPITEFPMFTFMFADLHAHLMVMPVSLLSLAVGLAAIVSAREVQGWPRARRLALEWTFVALLGLLVGTARWTNSWDFPTFGLMAAASLFIAQWRADRRLSFATLAMWLFKSATVLGVSLALFEPASRHFLAPATGFHRAEQTTQLDDYLWHFGLFVLIAAVGLGVWLYRSLGRTPSLGTLRTGTGVSLPLAGLVVALPAVFVFAATQRDRMGVAALAIVMLAVIVWLAASELARPKPDTHIRLFVLAMLAMAFGIGGGVELFTLKDDITRMNTVFKFYLHAWLLFGIASAVVAWYLLAAMRPDLRAAQAARAAGSRLAAFRPYATAGLAGALAVALLGVALYPILALPQRIDERFADLPRSINGMNFMAHATFNDFDDMGTLDLSKDYEGILWMRERVQGSPTIIEGVTPGYRWGSRYSIYTGLPAVAGWDWHQRQQRGKFGYLVTKRQEDVTTFYESADPAEQIAVLDRYDVRYVVLGQLERNYFPGPGLTNIEAGLNGRLQKVFDNGSTAIYAVAPKPIPGPPRASAH